MRNALILAGATFTEASRAKVFLYLIVVAILMIGASVPTAELGVGDNLRLITDVSMAGAGFVAAFLSIFLGVSSVSGEVEKRTVYTIIAKPVTRSQFVVGKYLGVLSVVTLSITLSYLLIVLLVSISSGTFATELLASWILVIGEMALLIAVATFFSCITRPMLSSGLTVMLYLVGISLKSLLFWVGRSNSDAFVSLMKALYWALPNFGVFDVKTELVHHLPVGADRIVFSLGYGSLYAAAVLCLATFVFQRRDLK